jgi:hypothetical protein
MYFSKKDEHLKKGGLVCAKAMIITDIKITKEHTQMLHCRIYEQRNFTYVLCSILLYFSVCMKVGITPRHVIHSSRKRTPFFLISLVLFCVL